MTKELHLKLATERITESLESITNLYHNTTIGSDKTLFGQIKVKLEFAIKDIESANNG